MSTEHWWNDIDRGTEGLRAKPVPVPVPVPVPRSPQQIPCNKKCLQASQEQTVSASRNTHKAVKLHIYQTVSTQFVLRLAKRILNIHSY